MTKDADYKKAVKISEHPNCTVEKWRKERSSWSWDECVKDEQCEIQFLVISMRRKAIALCCTDDSNGCGMLPGVLAPDSYQATRRVLELAETNCGLKFDSTMLRCVWYKMRDFRIPEEKLTIWLEKAVVALECHEEEEKCPPGVRWVPFSEARIGHHVLEAEKALRREIDDLASGYVPENRVAWACPGWYASASTWFWSIAQPLSGSENPGVLMQRKVSALGTVLSGIADGKQLFLKCSPKFANDVGVTEALAELAPEHVTMPVAIDRKQRMMVMDDYNEFGRMVQPSSLEKEEMKTLVKDFARVQQATIGRTNVLLKAGLRDLSPSHLCTNIEKILYRPEAESLGESGALEVLRQNIPTIKAKLRKLDNFGIPCTVTHNDLDSGNAYLRNGKERRYCFFDWGEACWCHPFIEFRWCSKDVRKAYLEEWTTYGGMQILEECEDLAVKLAGLVRLSAYLEEMMAMEEESVQEYKTEISMALVSASISLKREIEN